MWDAPPVFLSPRVRFLDRIKLLFYPKKWVLYRWIARKSPKRILDVGCGTGGAVIDLAKLFPGAEVVGVDVVEQQIAIMKERIKKYGVRAEALLYDGRQLPFPDGHFDGIYTSDVLGHVSDVPAWLAELSRVTKHGGTLAMFAESSLGKHAVVRRHLLQHGLNVDPHAPFHVSLYSRQELRRLLANAGFEVQKMLTVFLFAFFLHPEEFRPALQTEKRFPILRRVNSVLCHIKRVTHPVSAALAELWGLVEMLAIGRWGESQGYIILAKKR
jgi:ubiquinone/menaquinone biosynthesis C-methylase UbiE